MGTPVLILVFDRHCRATKTREGSVDLRITYERRQRFVTTGFRLFPRQWKNGQVVLL